MERIVLAPDAFIPQNRAKLRDVYKVGAKVGEGAFGAVRKVTHRATREVRAVKIIAKKVLNTPVKTAWLHNELQILRYLDHPHIIRLFESFEDDRNYYLVTEFCGGGELYERMVRTGYFSEALAARYMREIVAVVAYCHEKGVVHRDLKLDNFLLDSEEPTAALKVIDFGTATFFTQGQRFTDKFGTAYYIAPEVLKRNYTEKCDLWSLGVCLYILLCGSPPFPGTSDQQILRKVVKGHVEFPSPEWDMVSFEAKDLVCSLLRLDPEQRISAKDALDHPWLQVAAAVPAHPTLAKAAFRNLKLFASKLTFQKATLTLIAVQMCSKSEREEMEAVFQSLDRDQSGTLSKAELTEGLAMLTGQDPEDVRSEMEQLVLSIDGDSSGGVDYTEFIAAAMSQRRMMTQDRLYAAFKTFDLDGDGVITAAELRSVLGAGREYREGMWEEIVREADQNGDGVIDFEEFVRMMEHFSEFG